MRLQCILTILLQVVYSNTEIQTRLQEEQHTSAGQHAPLGQHAPVGQFSCESAEGWAPCTPGANCVNKSQICDGEVQCHNGRDESRELCDSWPCELGVRCQNSSICIPVPHQTMCTGSGKGSVCTDGSDQAYCLHTIYTGSFLNTTLGLRISNGEDCFCDLRDGEGARLFYRSMGRTHRSSHILGKVCIQRSDVRVCDGYPDCIHGEDEDPATCVQDEDTVPCGPGEDPATCVQEEDAAPCGLGEDQDSTTCPEAVPTSTEAANTHPERTGRKIENEHIEDSHSLQAKSMEEDEVRISYSVDLNLLISIFTGTVVSVLGICLLIIYVMFRLSRRKVKEPDYVNVSLPATFDRQVSAGSANIYVSNPRSPPAERKPTWSLRNTSIVKELGRGFYSKVYLAQDPTHGLVALKTPDSKRTEKEDDCISNEIEILSNLPPQQHIIKLIGQNTEEKLIVLEYCFHGNLKDYVTRNRDYFMNELDPLSGDLEEDAILYRSPTLGDSSPVSELVTSLHIKTNLEDETCKEIPVVKMSKSLVSTRRLLYWSYQMSRGLRYLSEMGIIHRDVALRNMLLTNNDIIKISDFGLAASLDGSAPVSPNKTPQYWSRSNKPQPYKWMAPESFLENVFSQKSEVWGFGVTLWELFSLGKEPYGDTTPASLHKMLNTGGRLQECKNAPVKVRLLMRECWSIQPICRPNFNSIVGVLSSYIGVREKQERDTRVDSGLGDVDLGYIDMTPRDSSGFSTTESTPSTSKFSTRSGDSYSKPSSRSRAVSRTSSSCVSIHNNGSNQGSSSHGGSNCGSSNYGSSKHGSSHHSGPNHGGSSYGGSSHGGSNYGGSNQRNGSIGTLLSDGSMWSSTQGCESPGRLNCSSSNLITSPKPSYWSNYKIVSGSSQMVYKDGQNHT